jgi:hypothetical protein
MAGRAMWGDTGVHAKVIGTALLNSFTDTVLAVSLLALLGSLTRAYFNIATYVVVLVGLSMSQVVLGFVRNSQNAVGRFLAGHPVIERSLEIIDQNLFPELPARLDTGWLLMGLSNAAIALLLACLAFRRREVPYGAD